MTSGITRPKDRVYLIETIKPNARGYRERCQYTGPRRQKPKGWRIVAFLGSAMAGDGSGLV